MPWEQGVFKKVRPKESFTVVWRPKGTKVPIFTTFPRILLAKARLERLRRESGKRACGWIWDDNRKCKIEKGYQRRDGRLHGRRAGK